MEVKKQTIHLPGISRLCKTMKETQKNEVVTLVGEPLPSYVTGIYLRTGPALFDLEDFSSTSSFQMRHLFDGYAMLTKLEINAASNNVSLTKKFLQSDSYRRAVAASKPVVAEFATGPKADPHQSFFSKVVHTLSPEFTDNNSSNITTIGTDVYTFGDTCYFREIDPTDLTSKEKHDTNKLFNLHFQCAHPLTDLVTGDVWNIGYSIFTGLKFHIFRMTAGKTSQDMLKTSKIVATVHSRWTSSMASVHSFGMSANYIILIEQPFVVSFSKIAASIIKKTAIYETMEWNGNEKNRFILINKTSGHVQQIEYYSAKSFHYLHVLNSYEDTENHQVVIDIITYPTPSYLDALYVSKLRNNILEVTEDLPQIQRFVIPIFEDNTKMDRVPENINLVNGSHAKSTAVRQGNTIILTPEPMAEKGLDMAIVSPALAPGKKHDYFYAASILSQNSVRNKIYKINTHTKEVTCWKQDEFTFLVGEPKFIADPKGTEQDDGVLICPIIDLRTEKEDFLLFLDKNMKEICRASFQQEIPVAFHGIFIPIPDHTSSASSSGAGTSKKHKKGEH